ncbi:MAG: hypothetical protein KDD70_14840 [Bdellovibrionales bacterium]|nr:hypothetical protein [Bdellovibrionales bacterium]
MALISIQNFVAPFENKTHLFTIIIIAALFGLWRVTGGNVSIRPTSNPIGTTAAAPASAQQSAFRTEQPVGNSPRAANSQPSSAFSSTAAPAAARQNSDLDALLAPSATRDEPVAQPAQQRPRSALDDIEKSLGMR